jgi:hypothetical protein
MPGQTANALRYAVTAAVFIGGIGLLVAGSAGPGWALIVVSVGWAAHVFGGSIAVGTPVGSDDRQEQSGRCIAAPADRNGSANAKHGDRDAVGTRVDDRRRRSDPR